jgi:membrane protease subunit (stomatin/prohibitin family)
MSLVDIVQHHFGENELVFKEPKDELKLGSQVVVGVSQIAFLIQGGKILHEFQTGTHTILNQNIPILNSIVNLPFGGQSPFKCEIWFVNLVAKLDLKWGTSIPIQLEDRKYGIIVSVRSYGQYGFQIFNPRSFFESLVGTLSSFSTDKLNDYLKGRILTELIASVTEDIEKNESSVIDLPLRLSTLSETTKDRVSKIFNSYGVRLVSFDIMSINIPDGDPSFLKLKESQAISAKIKMLGLDVYKMDRGYDVLEKAASNEGSNASGFLNAGLGLGAGFGLTQQMKYDIDEVRSFDSPTLYYLFQDDQQLGPFTRQVVMDMAKRGLVSKVAYLWKSGMDQWVSVESEPELFSIIIEKSSQTPPPFKSPS